MKPEIVRAMADLRHSIDDRFSQVNERFPVRRDDSRPDHARPRDGGKCTQTLQADLERLEQSRRNVDGLGQRVKVTVAHITQKCQCDVEW